MTDASIAGAERAAPERRARVRDHGASDRLDHIAAELAALRADLATFTRAQDAVNADFRAHVVRASVLGDLHTGDAEMFKREQAGHDVRLRAVEDWRVEMRTYGQILRLTFGASVLGLLIGLVGLINMFAALGR